MSLWYVLLIVVAFSIASDPALAGFDDVVAKADFFKQEYLRYYTF
jgi:hypothetical protein